jgi:hypothetical protein
MELAFCETEGGRNRHEEQRQEPYSKAASSLPSKADYRMGLNIVNMYFAMFNRASVGFLAIARDRLAASLAHFQELLPSVPDSGNSAKAFACAS